MSKSKTKTVTFSNGESHQAEVKEFTGRIEKIRKEYGYYE